MFETSIYYIHLDFRLISHSLELQPCIFHDPMLFVLLYIASPLFRHPNTMATIILQSQYVPIIL